MAHRIAVIDDEENIVKMIELRLKSRGFEVVTGNCGEDAMRLAKTMPDLIILDVMMPPPNGFQVCRTIKEDPVLSKIPVILLTARSKQADKFWGKEAHADVYLTKPYSAQELFSAIESLLKPAA
jgi:DNA-binding response OmpR family regulator